MFYILIILTIVLIETKIKDYIDKNKQSGEKEEVLNGKIIIRKQYNHGMAMSFLEDKPDLVKTVSCVLLGVMFIVFSLTLPKKGKKLFKLGLSLCLGGAVSNVADRIEKGYVVDYFSFNCEKLKSIIFNLSDMFIFLGSLLLALSSILPFGLKKSPLK